MKFVYYTAILLAIFIWPLHSQSTDYSAWSGFVTFKVSTEADWANVNSTVTNFPTLIQFSGNQFDFSLAQANGADIRFATDADINLPFEIERWDSANGVATIWVLVDTIYGSSSKDLRMYYGNTAVTNASDGEAVFDTASGFSAVYHLGQDPTSGTISEATANNFSGTSMGTMNGNSQVMGVSGTGLYFDGVDDHIELVPITEDFTQGITACGWANPTQLMNWARLFDFGNGAETDNTFLSILGAGPDLRWEAWNSAATTLDVPGIWSAETWAPLW